MLTGIVWIVLILRVAGQFADTVGRISRLCLQLGIVPVFVPPLEHGMQNTIESFNALWQAKVWSRYRVTSLDELRRRSRQYIAAHRARTQTGAESAPARPLISSRFAFDPHAPVRGRMIFIRRTDGAGHIHILGRSFAVNRSWLHRLVRCEVDFDHHHIDCFALRRRDPTDQPLLVTLPYHRLDKPFRGAK